MKFVFLFLSLCFSASAFAEVVQEVDFLKRISFDGTTLDYAYDISGGCAEHTGKVDVVIDDSNKFKVIGIVKIYDSTPDGDDCQSMVHVEGKADLKKLTFEKTKAAGLTSNYLELVLPAVDVSKH